MRLSNVDLQRVLYSVNQLVSDHNPNSLSGRTNDSVRSLISTDVLSFEGFGTDSHYQGPLWYTPAGTVSDERLRIMGELVQEHPCFNGVAVKAMRDAVRISDYMPLAKFKQTAIYNEFFRHLGTDRQLVAGLHVDAELMITCSLCRLQKDFTDRDCRIFDLLTPHLVAAFRSARFINRLKFESEQLNAALEFARYGIVTVDKNLRTQIESPIAAKFLQKYFKSESASLPDELNRYVKHHLPVFDGAEFYLPPIPLEISRVDAKLIIRLIFQSTTKTAVLLLEEVSVSAAGNLVGLGLTDRETEVLFWVSQGKTDGEIGTLLNISVRTVQKHVEHIFDKLGVETRTAASAAAFERKS